MTEDLERGLRELLDRQAIRDKLMAYCRGVDRQDAELLLSVYHPDAIDDHGMVVVSPQGFVDWVFPVLKAQGGVCQHIIANHSCELDGDTAHTETYWIAVTTAPGKPASPSGGRYIDRFEKRNGEWRIAARKCVMEWYTNPDGLTEAGRKTLDGSGYVARDRSDVSYLRPFEIPPERIGFRYEGHR